MVAQLSEAQKEAVRLLGSPATSILLRGGSRSGKTFVLVRSVVIRAANAAGSRHGIFRHRFNSLKASVVRDTFPKVMRECFPDLPYQLNQTDWFATFPNGSEIHFHGLDSEDRTEKILGLEFATVYLNEASQISYSARNILLTRLAQKTSIAPKEYIDANPPSTSHWLHDLFEKKIEPKSGEPLANPDAFATMRINPDSNKANLTPEYLAFLESLPERERIRFRDGNYQSAVQGALWLQENIQRDRPPADDRALEALKARMKRIVVAIDPSGCSGKEDFRSDEVGMVVCGIDRDKKGHVLEDCSDRYSPAEWAAQALKMYDKWQADAIVAESNFGGAMVESNIKTTRASANVIMVRASRGKIARAEPVASLYAQGKVIHHGRFTDLEEQLSQFTAAGYLGSKSPDRADAMVWGMTELMLGQSYEPARWNKTRFSIGR